MEAASNFTAFSSPEVSNLADWERGPAETEKTAGARSSDYNTITYEGALGIVLVSGLKKDFFSCNILLK